MQSSETSRCNGTGVNHAFCGTNRFQSVARAPAVKTDGLATVIVSCCGQLEYTRLCVPSLLRFTRQPYELLFLDSDSRDGTAEYLEGLAGAAPVPVEVARVPADPPVGTAKKDEVIPLRGEFVALLNNDVIVTQAWLDRLIALAASAPNIGLVAPMSNHGPQALRVDNVSYAIDDLESVEFGKPSANGTTRLPRSSLLPLIDKVNRFAVEWREKHANDKSWNRHPGWRLRAGETRGAAEAGVVSDAHAAGNI